MLAERPGKATSKQLPRVPQVQADNTVIFSLTLVDKDHDELQRFRPLTKLAKSIPLTDRSLEVDR